MWKEVEFAVTCLHSSIASPFKAALQKHLPTDRPMTETARLTLMARQPLSNAVPQANRPAAFVSMETLQRVGKGD